MKKETFLGIFLAIMTIWAIGFAAPRLYQIYKDKPMEIKTDTIVYTDTLYFEVTKTDTLPKTVYQTIVEKDTLYKVIGDSIEAQPRVVLLKKKTVENTIDLEGQDSLSLQYTAQITGRSYEDEDYPKMDSIRFNLSGFIKRDKEVITNTIIRQQKTKKWHISPNIGFGYGIVNRKPDIYVGIGISYDF